MSVPNLRDQRSTEWWAAVADLAGLELAVAPLRELVNATVGIIELRAVRANPKICGRHTDPLAHTLGLVRRAAGDVDQVLVQLDRSLARLLDFVANLDVE